MLIRYDDDPVVTTSNNEMHNKNGSRSHVTNGHSRKNRKTPALPRAHPLTCLIKTEKGKGFQWSVGPFLSGLYQFGVNIYMLVLLIYKCNVWIDREVMMKSGENLSEFLKED